MSMQSSIYAGSRGIVMALAVVGLFMAKSLSAQVSAPAKRVLVARYSLILFDIDSPRIDGLNRRILQEYILPDIAPGSGVDVIGYSDIIGTDEHDLALSTQRAAGAARLMAQQIPPSAAVVLESHGVGRNAPLYSNELPEGRFYNRTVRINVMRPGR